jgi:hypothetical protein
MHHENKNPDNEQKFNVSDKFVEDIKKLYRASVSVPPEVDRAILDKASQKLILSRKRIRILRWAGSVAAAAAIIIFACLLFFNTRPTPADIDGNGRVDILDAFKLAKQIQSATTPEKKWDLNGDGLVNKDDVDIVANTAVSLDKGVL